MQLYILIHFQKIETSLLINFNKVFSSNTPSWTHANSIAKLHHHHNFYANNVSHKLEHELIWTNLCASWYNPSQTTPPPINPSPLPSQSTKCTAQVCPVRDPPKIWSQISFPSKIPRIWDEMNRFSLSSEITTRYKWNWTFTDITRMPPMWYCKKLSRNDNTQVLQKASTTVIVLFKWFHSICVNLHVTHKFRFMFPNTNFVHFSKIV